MAKNKASSSLKSPAPTAANPTPRAAKSALPWVPAALLLAALVLRVWASLNDFWLDEIWSYDFARQIHSFTEIFTRLHHDNNHHLNTLLMYVLGDQSDWLIYRIPSVIAGTSAVAMAGLIARRRGRAEALFAMVLTTFSFLLIQYSSEARGYSLAVFFCLAAFYVAQLHLDNPTWKTAAGFDALVALALLSHLTAIHFYVGCLLWTVIKLWRAGPTRRRALRNITTMHAGAILFLAVFYLGCVRGMEIGGKAPFTYGGVLSSTMGLMLGAPQWPAATVAAMIVLAALLLIGLYVTWRDRSGEWLLFVGGMALSPALSLMLFTPQALFERYFLICAALGLVLVSFALGWLWRKNLAAKTLCGLLLATFLVGNAFHTNWLLRVGRGNFQDAVAFLALQSSSDPIYVSSNSDFRSGTTLRFYCRYLQVPRTFIYVPDDPKNSRPVEWVLFDRQDIREPQPPVIRDRSGATYDLMKTFDILSPDHPACLSGWSWSLYHNRAAQRGFADSRPDSR